MTRLKRATLVIAAITIGMSACKSEEKKSRAESAALAARQKRFQARLAKAEASNVDEPVALWIMPPELKEISGLALTPDGRLFTHNDEVARVFEIDPRAGIVKKSFMLGKGLRGDFEGITVAGQDLYMILSNGVLYKFREGANGASVPYTTIDTRLGKECEFEGVAYEKDSARLVLPCKNVKLKGAGDEMVIYRWKTGSTDTTGLSVIKVPFADVIGSGKGKRFRPSDVTIEPGTGNYVLISSLDKGLVVMTPAGQVLRSEPLPGRHLQAEGVAITRDNILIISDEATSRPAAITLYKWNKPDPGAVTQ